MPIEPGALFRAVGLTPDGPARWGTPIRMAGPGVFLVQWPAPLDRAPIDISAVGTWLARVETLRVDGERPTGKALAVRLAAWWLPGETVVFVGSGKSLGRRIETMAATPLGDARPNPAGQWFKALRGFEGTRLWWAATDAVEEYEDALLEAFAAALPAATAAALPAGSPVLPFANRRRPGGSVRPDGISGSTAEPAAPAAPLPSAAGAGGSRRRPGDYSDDDLARLNDLLQRIACGEPALQITPSQANAEGAVRRLLGEDPSRPASALGQLLRAGKIEGARQDLDGRWAIRCARRGD
ncbi:MAG TPA: hypothetical protein VER83_10255 [Candidatus Nanopelagicales bacterium]|nr:hypothetical protein [Candidatus Nanopelagicales bacterium]